MDKNRTSSLFSIYVLIQLLDVFAHCEPDDDAQRSTLDEALKKKLEQMCQYQRRLLKSIRCKSVVCCCIYKILTFSVMDKYRMPEPFRVDASEGSIPIVFYGQAAIKPTADNGKTQKKGNGGDEDRPVPADNDANEVGNL